MKLPGSYAFILLLVVASVFAQKLPKLTLDKGLEECLPAKESSAIGDLPVQYEMRKLEEEEGDAVTDREFETEITNDDDNTLKLPTVDEARRVYNSQIDRVAQEAEKAGDSSLKMRSRVSINPVFQYYSLEAWQKPILRCCPRSWNYQCRSSNVRLPCFSYYYGCVREMCCPIWPSVFVKRCMCSQCAVLTPTCAHEGRCRSRYSRRSFLAVCYRSGQWGYLRYITKYLPSSCYCRI